MVGLDKDSQTQKIKIKTGSIVDVYTVSKHSYNISELNNEISKLESKINNIKSIDYPKGASQELKRSIDKFNSECDMEKESLGKIVVDLSNLVSELEKEEVEGKKL